MDRFPVLSWSDQVSSSFICKTGYGPAIEEEGAGSEVEVDDVPGEVEHRSGSSIEDESSSDNERYGSPMSEVCTFRLPHHLPTLICCGRQITGSAELEAYSSGVTPLSESPKFKVSERFESIAQYCCPIEWISPQVSGV